MTEHLPLVLDDARFGNRPIDMPLQVLLGKPPRMRRVVAHVPPPADDFEASVATLDVREAAFRLLRLPTVADKTFLVTIGDRSVTGLVARDQMVGRYQVPVADAAVTASSYDAFAGEAMAMGEPTPLALPDAPAPAPHAGADAPTRPSYRPGSTHRGHHQRYRHRFRRVRESSEPLDPRHRSRCRYRCPRRLTSRHRRSPSESIRFP